MLRTLGMLARAGEGAGMPSLPATIWAWQRQQAAGVSTSGADSAPEPSAVALAGSKPVMMKEFQVYRWDPDTPDAKPNYVSYKVDINRCVMIC